MSVDLVVPFGISAIRADRTTSHREVVPERPTVGFVDNGKARAGDLLDATGRALVASGVIETYFIHRKSLHMLPLDDGERDELLSRADVVVVGVGDCGGCTACAVTDALRCLESGAAAFVVVTHPFVDLAESTDLAYGLDGLNRLTVEHPIWTRDPDWFRDTGSSLAVAVAARLSDLRREPRPLVPTREGG